MVILFIICATLAGYAAAGITLITIGWKETLLIATISWIARKRGYETRVVPVVAIGLYLMGRGPLAILAGSFTTLFMNTC